MFKYTAGPWKAGEMGGRFVVFVDDGTRTSTTIADEIQEERDAKLIAAAPELLIALKNLLNFEGLTSPDECDTAQAYQEAREAIIKATGKCP